MIEIQGKFNTGDTVTINAVIRPVYNFKAG